MKNMVKDPNSGALLRVPSPEETQIEKLSRKVDAIYNALSDAQKKKVDKEVNVDG